MNTMQYNTLSYTCTHCPNNPHCTQYASIKYTLPPAHTGPQGIFAAWEPGYQDTICTLLHSENHSPSVHNNASLLLSLFFSLSFPLSLIPPPPHLTPVLLMLPSSFPPPPSYPILLPSTHTSFLPPSLYPLLRPLPPWLSER